MNIFKIIRKNYVCIDFEQFGLAIFRKDLDSNTYFIDAYNFYLFPVAFDAFAKRDLLICQISCINFLARHNFDFNKVINNINFVRYLYFVH